MVLASVGLPVAVTLGWLLASAQDATVDVAEALWWPALRTVGASGLAAVAWFIQPILFIVLTTVIVAVLYRRDFASPALAAFGGEG